MEYEHRRHCVTVLGWQDPRGLDDDGQPLIVRDEAGVPALRDEMAAQELEQRDGLLMWPERFGPKEIARIKAELGPYMASGRLQQPRSGREQLNGDCRACNRSAGPNQLGFLRPWAHLFISR